MLKRINETVNQMQQTRYVFERTGDILPMHEHQIQDFHDTAISRGSVKISGLNWEIIARAGEEIIYDWYQASMHQIEALEDDTEIVNRYRMNSGHRERNQNVWLSDEIYK